MLVSVGGNDVGFSRLLANAVLSDESTLRKLGGWFGQVHGFIEANSQLDALDDRMKSLNRALHNLLHVPWPESDRIILTGYPPMALLDDGKTVCPDGQAGMTVMSDFSLSEAKAAEGIGVRKKGFKCAVVQVIVETRGVSANPIAPATEQRVEGKARLLCRQIPERNLQGFVKGKRIGPLVASARTIDSVDQGRRVLPLEARPGLNLKDADNFCERGEVREQSLDEAQATISTIIDQLKAGDIDSVGANLTVTNDPVTGKLEPGQYE